MKNTEELDDKRKKEMYILIKMIGIYCHEVHGTQEGLCPQCEELLAYAQQRIRFCPHMASKTFCSACTTHCYAPVRREAIQRIMRYSGPRMLRYHPILAIKHMWLQWKQKNK